jgi:hypothetical protein
MLVKRLEPPKSIGNGTLFTMQNPNLMWIVLTSHRNYSFGNPEKWTLLCLHSLPVPGIAQHFGQASFGFPA